MSLVLNQLILSGFVCTAALAILDRLDIVDEPMLAWWLAERQLPNGGLNGRPEKLEDVSARHLSGVTSTDQISRFATAFGSYLRCLSCENLPGLTRRS